VKVVKTRIVVKIQKSLVAKKMKILRFQVVKKQVIPAPNLHHHLQMMKKKQNPVMKDRLKKIMKVQLLQKMRKMMMMMMMKNSLKTVKTQIYLTKKKMRMKLSLQILQKTAAVYLPLVKLKMKKIVDQHLLQSLRKSIVNISLILKTEVTSKATTKRVK
jgi:hypothetical protein